MHVLMIVAATVMLGAPIGQVTTSSVQMAPARDTAPADKKGTAVIKGQVLSADTGRPVRRVHISASSPEALREKAEKVTVREGETPTVTLTFEK